MKFQTEMPLWADYRLPPLPMPEGMVLWAGGNAPPTLGSVVAPTLNGWDGNYKGTVVGYSTDHGWLGIILEMETRPVWHVREMPNKTQCYFAGNEGF